MPNRPEPVIDHGPVSDSFGLRNLDVDVLRAKRVAKWQVDWHGGRPGYAAWVADMDFPVAPAIRQALRDVIDRDEFGYPDWGGPYAPSPAATLFPQRMADRYGWDIDTARLHELDDVLQGVRATVLHLTAPGDGVVLHMPAYPPFIDTLASMDRRLIPVEWNGEQFDYDALERALVSTSARLWILCHPHNPLGHVFAPDELERIVAIAARHDLVIISDEIHADLTLLPARHHPLATISAEAARRTVTVTSASKAYNLAGMRWAIAHAGSDALHHALVGLPRHYLGAPNKMAVTATVAAWTKGSLWLDAVLAVIDENRHALASLLAVHLPEAAYRPPDATYLAWIDVRRCGFGDDPAATCRERGVELSSGLQFGPQGAGFVRLNLATSPHLLERIVARVGRPS